MANFPRPCCSSPTSVSTSTMKVCPHSSQRPVSISSLLASSAGDGAIPGEARATSVSRQSDPYYGHGLISRLCAKFVALPQLCWLAGCSAMTCVPVSRGAVRISAQGHKSIVSVSGVDAVITAALKEFKDMVRKDLMDVLIHSSVPIIAPPPFMFVAPETPSPSYSPLSLALSLSTKFAHSSLLI